MTPAAIRAAEGPALEAFVLERVCGVQWEAGRCGVCGWPFADTLADGCVPGCCSQRPMPARRADDPAPISTDDAACWRWVVPALRARGWTVGVESSLIDPSVWYGTLGHMRHDTVLVEAPTPALAIVRAAALTVVEEER